MLTPVLSPQNSKNLSAELSQFKRLVHSYRLCEESKEEIVFLKCFCMYVGADKQCPDNKPVIFYP